MRLAPHIRFLAIEGVIGVGKTTLALHLAVEAAKAGMRPANDAGFIHGIAPQIVRPPETSSTAPFT